MGLDARVRTTQTPCQILARASLRDAPSASPVLRGGEGCWGRSYTETVAALRPSLGRETFRVGALWAQEPIALNQVLALLVKGNGVEYHVKSDGAIRFG